MHHVKWAVEMDISGSNI